MTSNQVDRTMIDGVHYRQSLQFYGCISLLAREQFPGEESHRFLQTVMVNTEHSSDPLHRGVRLEKEGVFLCGND